jgi:hypothetical protein
METKLIKESIIRNLNNRPRFWKDGEFTKVIFPNFEAECKRLKGKWKITINQNQETKQESLESYLKSKGFVQTVKGWINGFTLVYLDKKTYRIKHTINNTKGSRLYKTNKHYKNTINHFLTFN